MSEEEIEEIKKELNKSVNNYTPKIRTGEQLERENYLLCFRSKSQLASMLIDAEEKIDKAVSNLENSIKSINDKLADKEIRCENGRIVNPINDYRVVRLKGIRTKCNELLKILKGNNNE